MLALDEHILEVASGQNADLASVRQEVDGGVDRRVLPHALHSIADSYGAAATAVPFLGAGRQRPGRAAICRRARKRNDGQPRVVVMQSSSGSFIQLLY